MTRVAVCMQAELDRFVNALIAIREEVREIEEGKADKCVPSPVSPDSCFSSNLRRCSHLISPTVRCRPFPSDYVDRHSEHSPTAYCICVSSLSSCWLCFSRAEDLKRASD